MPSAAEDRSFMGTREDAETALTAKLREWRELRQPSIDTAKNHRDRERRENQLRFEICNAGLHWLWLWSIRPMQFTELAKQEYAGNNCKFSTGKVTGASNPSDTLYLRIEKDLPDGSKDERTYLLRPDEMAAIAFVASGAVWSDNYDLFDRLEKFREQCEKQIAKSEERRLA